jgi:hypothetical protein
MRAPRRCHSDMDGEKTQPAANRGALAWDFDLRREDGSLRLNHP